MCRLYAFRANEPTRLKCSLVLAQNALMAQSQSDRRGNANAHGWGVSCYDNTLPWVEKRETAAHQDGHFSDAAERIYARTVVAHVRHATVGGNSAFNAHPFTFGRWSFAHNGTLYAFDRLEAELEQETDEDLQQHRQGQTDSELMFLWLLSRLRQQDAGRPDPRLPFEKVMATLVDAVNELDRRSRQANRQRVSRLNFILTDGRMLFASRLRNSLHMLEQTGPWLCRVCGRNHTHGIDYPHYRSVTVASEPISRRNWKPVPKHSIVGIDADMSVHVQSLDTATIAPT